MSNITYNKMKKILCLFILSFIFIVYVNTEIQAQCPAVPTCTKTAVAGTSYTLTASDVLCISSNYNSGNITINGGTVIVQSGGTLGISPSITTGTINIATGGTLTSDISASSSATLNNCGKISGTRSINPNIALNNYGNNDGALLSLKQDNGFTLNNYGKNLSVSIDGNPNGNFTINNAVGATITSLATTHPTSGLKAGSVITNLGAINLTSDILWEGTINNGNASGSQQGTITTATGVQVEFRGPWTINNNPSSTIQIDKIYLNNLSSPGQGALLSDQSVLSVNTIVGNNIVNPIKGIGGCSYFKSYNVFSSTSNQNLFLQVPPGSISYCGPVPVNSAAQTFGIVSVVSNGATPALYRVTVNSSNNSGSINGTLISIRFVTGNQSNGYWKAKLISTTSGTATYDLLSPDGGTYTFDNAATAGTGTFYWTASTFGNAYYAGYDCNNPALTTKIVTAGPSQSACANNPTVTLAGNFSVAPGIVWSGGAGTFVPNNTTKNATYTPTAAEIAAGSVTLTITTTGTTPCNQQSDKVTISYTTAPTVNAGPPVAGCVNNASITLSGTAANQTGVTWSGGTGTFSPASSLNTTYTPSAAEKTGNPKTITLTLTANKTGCNAVTSNVDVTINPSPVVNAGRDTVICKNDSFNLQGIVLNATGGTWSGGTGTFTPNANSLTANYKPSASELTGTSVTLTLTSTGNGACLAVADQMIIKFTPAPTIKITGPSDVCENNPVITLSSAITDATGQSWLGSGGSFTPNTTTSPIVYTPSAAEISFGFTGIIAKTTGGKCPPVTDTIIVTFGPAPKVDAGPPVSICENNPTGSLTGSVTGVSTVTWTSPTGGLFTSPTNPVTNYIATSTDITNGSVILTVTATKPTCNPVTDQVVVTITPKPTVSAGPARTVCANNATATFNGSFTGATGVVWTTSGDGTFGSATSATTTYTAGPNDITAGTVTLSLTTTGNGNCLAVVSTSTLSITPRPTVTPGTYSVCANNATVQLNGAVTIATGGTWVGGAGTFSPGRNVLNPTYTPTAAETAAGSLSLTLQSTGNGNCNAVTGSAAITFTPAPTITPTTPANVCADVPAATITTTKTVATGVLWSGGAGTIAVPTNLSTTYTPTTTEINAGSVTLTVTTTGNGLCSPVSANVLVKIAPAPTVNAGPNQVVCGTVSTVSNLSGTVTGATGGTWTKVSGTGTFGNANNTSTTYTPSNQDVLNGSVTLKLTTTGNGLCQAVSNTMTITYTPVPSINAGVDQIVCSTELPVKLSASGSPANWNPSAGTYANAASLITTYSPSAGEIAAGTVTLSISTIASGACPVKTSQLTITIPPGPVVNTGPASQTMCGSLSGYQLNGSVTNATGGFWSTSGTGAFTPNANALNAIYTPSALDRTNGSVVLTLTSTGNGSCQQVSKTVTLTITPAIIVSAGPNQTLCADVSGITLNGSLTTATGGIWSITSGSGSIASPTSLITTYNPSAADIAAGTVSFLLTSTGNGGCPAVTSTVTHTLTPAPTLTQGPDQSICGDSAYVQLNATFTVATGIKWTSNGTGTFSPNNVTANARYTPSAADVSNGTVTLTATTTGNGTCNPVVKNLTITITPVVLLTIPSTQSVCQNNATVTLTASTSATAVSWTTSGTGTFASPTSPSTTYAPSAADIAAGVVTLTNKTTGITNCKTQTGIVQVIIAPSPVVDAGMPQTVCSTTPSISLNGSVLHAGGGTWTSNGTGTFANANAPVTTYAPSKADTTAGSVIFTLTSTGNGTCTPVSKNVTVTFKKVAIVNAGPNQTICGDSAYVQLAGSIVNAGGGVWTKSGTGTFMPSTIDLNAVYSPTPADKASGSVTITLTSTSNGECPAVSKSMVITITPAPVITVSADKTVCANNAVTNVSGTFTVSSTIKWTTSGSGTFTPDNTSSSVTYTPSAIDKAAGSVVLAMSTTANGTCKPAQGYLTLTITPTPVLNAGFDKTICGDSTEIKLDQATVTSATGVQWSTNGSGVFGPNNTVTQPIYYPTAADKLAGKVKLAAVTTGNGSCLPVRDTIEITITPIPTVNAGSDISICADTNNVKLAGSSTIAGGVKWTSTGTGTFTPSAFVANASYIPSNDQTVTLTLTTTNNGTCKPVSDDLLVLVAPKPVVDAGTDKTVCANVTQVLLTGTVTNATGGLWTTNGSGSFLPSSSTLTPNYVPSASDLSLGTVTLTLASTGNGLCKTVSDNVTVTFNPVATVSAGNDLQACISSTTVNVNGSSTNVSSVNWQIVSGNGSLSTTSSLATTYNVSPADITAGSVTLRITGTALSSCSNVSDDVVITFVTSPPINAGPDKTVCSTDFPIALEGSGSSAQWSGGTGTFSPNNQTLNALYTPSAAEVAAHTVTLTLQAITSGSCPAPSDQVTFTILDGPQVDVDAGTVSKICANTPSVNLSGSTTGVNSTGVTWTTSGSGTFANVNTLNPVYTPSLSDKNGGEVVITISSTGNNAACKPATDTMHLIITPAPQISTGGNQTICGDAATVDISSSFSNATGVVWSNVSANGSYASSTSANTKYLVATPADTTAGSITIQVTTTGQLPSCPAATDQMTITFTKKPAVSAGSPITVCTDTTSIPLNGSVSIATGGVWSSASGGSFIPNAHQLNAKYIPSAADKASGTVNLVLTSTGNGSCNAYSGNVAITLNPQPTISGSVPNDSICTGNTVSATANVTNTSSLIWKTTGTGTFSTTTGTSTIYTPSTSDELNGGVIIYASTVGSNPCKEIEKYFSITILKSPGALVNAGFDQIACADAGFFPLNGIIDGLSGTGIWTSSTGKGDFYPDATDLNPIFVPAQEDIDAGGLTITLSTTNNSICPPYSDDMILTINPAPEVSASASAGGFPPLCADTAYIQLNPTITNSTGGEWSTTGTGIFSPSITALNAVYVPSAEDRQKGLIGLTLTTTGNGTCNAYFDFMTIHLTPKPTINAGPDKIVCADQVLDLNATTTVASGVDWTSSGTGFFTSAANSLNTQYIMSDIDTTNRIFNVFAKTVNQGLCKPVYDTVRITVQPVPVVLASADQIICADATSIQVRAGIRNATGVVWTTDGFGSFTPNASGNPVTYNLAQADAAKGTIELYATSGNSGICSSGTDTIKVTISPTPTISAGAPIICKTALGAKLNGVVNSGTTTGTTTWSSSGSGIFAVNQSVLDASYYPTAADIAAGQVTLTLTASNYGTCNAVASNAILYIEPMPVADAGQDQYSCVGGSVTVSANNTQTGVTYSWTDNASVIVQPANAKSHTFVVSATTQRILLAEDAKGCVASDTVNITTFELPQFTLPAIACYSENLMVQSNPSPQPTVPGIYQWFDGGTIMTGENKSFLIVPDTGTYKIEFSFANCAADDQVVVKPAPTITAADIIACGNGTLTASTTTPGATIAWSLNGTAVGSGSPITITSSANDTIKYDIRVTNPATTCFNTDSVYVIGLPIPQMVELDSTSCIGLTVELTAIPTNIPNLDQFLDIKYDWRKNSGAIFSQSPTVIVNSAGTFKGAMTIGQCKDTSTNNISFSEYPTSTLPDSYTYCPETDKKVVLNPGTLPNTTYTWNNGFIGNMNTVSPKDDSTYVVTVTNQFFCSITDQTIVYTICAPVIDVPTAFTPDITGSGDQTFRGFGKYETNYKMMVFNRWGEVIFISNDKLVGWDGTYLGAPAQSGVYPWIVTYEGRAQYKGPYKKTGQVTLIR
ncbi:CHU large protein, possible SAP or adhesin AidA-related protein [Cytophaga hutchinsonii ATCC 33406]|uniref:CHU large protein, possible SAP or adhesin AidA-related protein n=2 Tax=Cytophaga hutchinsonii TaxID=985 RepID=A0A6N4SS71_CYTH3|nr:CHU large protein, possible SAP or adhesin AidA-related protein [Cytophaga hutchinsonii ATCC 33406]